MNFGSLRSCGRLDKQSRPSRALPDELLASIYNSFLESERTVSTPVSWTVERAPSARSCAGLIGRLVSMSAAQRAAPIEVVTGVRLS